ncbi:MAG TPA: glycosyltransferase, partial [Phaeodactylibacter sp.]|nr:glycosyltransferase [Phaeodactylibacter sp.]
MKKPRIIFTVINDLNYDQRMIRIGKSLVKSGYEVLLVGRQLSSSQPLQPQPFQQKRLHCFFQKGKLFYLEYNLRLLFFLWKKNFDAVCAIDLDTILPAFYVSKWKGKKMVYDAHEYFTEVPEVVRRPRVKQVWEWVGNHTVSKIKYCYTVGNALAKVLE